MVNDDKPMPYEPSRMREPLTDDELGVEAFKPDPWWHDWLLVAVALLVLVLVFAPLGV